MGPNRTFFHDGTVGLLAASLLLGCYNAEEAEPVGGPIREMEEFPMPAESTWRARTDNQGRAELFTGMFPWPDPAQPGDVDISVTQRDDYDDVSGGAYPGSPTPDEGDVDYDDDYDYSDADGDTDGDGDGDGDTDADWEDVDTGEEVEPDPVEPPTVNDDPGLAAGQLTAGEWRDLDHWSEWLNTVDPAANNQFDMALHWEFDTRTRIPVTVLSAAGLPVIDAAVLLETVSQGAYRITVEKDGQSVTTGVTDVELSNGAPVVIELPEQGGVPNNLDVMFLVDTTGSMGDELEYLKAEMVDVIDRVNDGAQELDIQVSVGFYRDTTDEYVLRMFPFTNDREEAAVQTAEQSARGGGDYEEAVETGLYHAVMDQDWRSSARARLLFLLLDAPPHHTEVNLNTLHYTTLAAATQGIRVIPVASSGIDENTEFLLRFLDIATGGTYVFLTDDSGIGSAHNEANVPGYNVEYLNDLLVRLIAEATAI